MCLEAEGICERCGYTGFDFPIATDKDGNLYYQCGKCKQPALKESHT